MNYPPTQKMFDISPERHEIVGIVCQCGWFVTERVRSDNPEDVLFYCRLCRVVIEPPVGIRKNNVYYDVDEVKKQGWFPT